MFPNAPASFVLLSIALVVVIANVGLSLLWGIFAVTLGVTTIVAILRSIPRKEK
jgi:hypothetical protein